MRLTITLLLLTALTVPRVALAQSALTYGPGTNSCGTWMQDKAKENQEWIAYFMDRAWVLGFISGVGVARIALAPTNHAAVTVYLDNYCQAHPLDHISEGAMALVQELRQKAGEK